MRLRQRSQDREEQLWCGVGAGRRSRAQVELGLQRPSGVGWAAVWGQGAGERQGEGLQEAQGQGAPQHLTEPPPAEDSREFLWSWKRPQLCLSWGRGGGHQREWGRPGRTLGTDKTPYLPRGGPLPGSLPAGTQQRGGPAGLSSPLPGSAHGPPLPLPCQGLSPRASSPTQTGREQMLPKGLSRGTSQVDRTH